MPTVGQFVDALKGTSNYSGGYAIEQIEGAAPTDRWQATLGQELTPGMASALFDAVKSRLEEVRGYYETPEGLELVGGEINDFVAEFGLLATQFGVELPNPQD